MKSTTSHTALNSAVTLPIAGRRNGYFDVSGTFVATLVAETSVDGGATWQGHPIRSGNAYVASVTAVGRYYLEDLPEVPGAQVRVRVSAYTSGTPGVDLNF